ncbi:MAG TPA: glycosyltransferase family 2 protein, partial [Dehalococcoidia bacterium]
MNDRRVALTVILPVLNEERNIAAAIESVAWADEIIVVDSRSTDRTCEIGATLGAQVRQFDYTGRGPKKKAWALANVTTRNEWVLILDADERVTPALRAEIESAIAAGSEYGGYCIDREFIFMGRSLRCFRPNWNLRLFRRDRARVEDLGMSDVPDTGDNEIHEHVRVDGRTGFLRAPLLHDDYR